MKYSLKTGPLTTLATDCLIATPALAGRVVAQHRLTDYWDSASSDFVDKPGQVQLINLPKSRRNTTRRILLVGCGGGAELTPADFRKAMLAAGTALKSPPLRNAALAIDGFSVTDYDTYQKVRVALALLSGQLYRFDAPKRPDDTNSSRLERVVVVADARGRTRAATAIRHAQALDSGLRLTRDLGNQPPNVCNPSYLAREARKLARQDKMRSRVVDQRELAALGMGAFTAVAQGSDTPAKLIIVEYRGAAAKTAPLVLVGKGITFDSGGISLKPGAGMDEMKFDMCGAAAVLGTLAAAAEARLPINLVALLAAAENMPSGRATRPGDVIQSLSGQTVEILNTDAEGRLVLCDTLTYAERYKPAVVIDVATLTGACMVALGAHASGLFTNNDALARELLAAGEFIWDRAWQLPLWDDYQQSLKSNFADMANVGGRDGGAIIAACFLSRFAKKFDWAHLDIAATAWNSGPTKGATGRPVALLFQYLLDRSGLA
jgi:leucyl aminopeptidase